MLKTKQNSRTPRSSYKVRRLCLTLITTLLVGRLCGGCTVRNMHLSEHQLAHLMQPAVLSAELRIQAVPFSSPSPSPVYMVSLQQAETDVKNALALGALPEAPLSLAGLTDIVGFRWDQSRQDIQLLGERGSDPALFLAVEQFVTALRIGHQAATGMTLVPTKPSQFQSTQEVQTFPAGVEDTLFIAPHIAADYLTKQLALKHLVTHYTDKYAGGKQYCVNRQKEQPSRIVFLPAPPVIEVEENQEGSITVWLRKADVILKSEAYMAAASGQTAYRPSPDIPLEAFAETFTAAFPEFALRFPVYKRLQTMFKVFLIARILRLSKRLPYDFGFWLSDYPVSSRPTPRELPSFQPTGLWQTCRDPADPSLPRTYWGSPDPEHKMIQRTISGGVLIVYDPYFSGFPAALALDPVVSVKASGTEHVASPSDVGALLLQDARPFSRAPPMTDSIIRDMVRHSPMGGSNYSMTPSYQPGGAGYAPRVPSGQPGGGFYMTPSYQPGGAGYAPRVPSGQPGGRLHR
jgi:hypothetical protein